MTEGGLNVFVIAGEPSGDRLGARLMRSLTDSCCDTVRFSGIGGPEMTRCGLESLFPMSDLSIMGVAEVLPRLPELLARIRETVDAIRVQSPDLIVTIDAPDFCFRVMSRLVETDIPRVHMVAPSVWAWRAGRAKKIAPLYDLLLALLPFEPPFFEREGLACEFIGHPVLESGADKGDGAACRAALGIDADSLVLAVLPGSRGGEIDRLLPVFRRTVKKLAARVPGLVVVLPTLESHRDRLTAAVKGWPVPVHVIVGEDAKFDAFATSTAALAASGTVSVELAMAGVPMVVAYRFNPISFIIGKCIVRVRYASLINLIAGRAIIPEYIQGACTSGKLVRALDGLFTDKEQRWAQLRAFKSALKVLGHGGPPPAQRAADRILDLLAQRRYS
ncbi:MAG: lipid-A-disaccharide synthase [Pseudomonadota bacterium]|nr:lipid-A-disaccharide synthase [Pseudomonadota bacterium]